MKVFFSKWEAIIDLQERGFTEDFELSGEKILWVQQKTLLLSTNFELMESYFFPNEPGKETIISAVMLNSCCAKGILITHHKTGINKISTIVTNKIMQSGSYQSYNNYDYSVVR